MCVCVVTPEGINNYSGMIYDRFLLLSVSIHGFAVNVTHGCGTSNKMHHQLQPKTNPTMNYRMA